MADFDVVVAAGSMRSIDAGAVHFSHRWTETGVTVEAAFTGAHLLHLAAAGCVLNDLYREADRLGLRLDGVRVSASGGFDDDWGSTGITYTVALDTTAADDEQRQLLVVVDEVAEIPHALRLGADVRRA